MPNNRLWKKGFVIGIIVLFFGMIFASNIIAVNLSKQDSIELDSKIISAVTETSKEGFDIELEYIYGYEYHENIPAYDSVFTAKIVNVGDEQYTGRVGYDAVAINLRTKNEDCRCSVTKSGGLQPSESWYEETGLGLHTIGLYIFPTPFLIQFTATPSDSNPENNYLEHKYLIWSGPCGNCYKLIIKTKSINKMEYNMFLLRFLNNFQYYKK